MKQDSSNSISSNKLIQGVVAFFKQTVILWVFVALFIALSFLSPAFIKPGNLLNVAKQISINGILAVGMTIVIISGGIDLSVGSIVALSGVCASFLAVNDNSLPLIVPIIVALAVGTLVGLLNGIGIAYGRFQPFIMTLAMMISVRGIALVMTGGMPVFNLKDSFNSISNSSIFGIPKLVYFIVACMFIGQFILRKTVFGKWVYSIGGNEVAARFSGINVKRVKLLCYTLSGLLAGLCGLLMASRITSGNGNSAQSYELNAIAAAAIGGTSMSGGIGNIFGTIVGALIIGVIQNGLDILGVSPFYQQVLQGAIIILAVFLDSRSKSKLQEML